MVYNMLVMFFFCFFVTNFCVSLRVQDTKSFKYHENKIAKYLILSFCFNKFASF